MSNLAASSDVESNITLYDSEIKRIADGPLAWYNTRLRSCRNIDDVHKGLTEQFEKIGFRADVGVHTMGECRCGPLVIPHHPDHCPHLVPIEGAYFFKVTILARINKESGFDYDQMKHEVRSNLLGIPGEGGTIKFDEKEFLRQHGGGKYGRHSHGE